MYKIILEKPVQKFLEKHRWEKIISKFYTSLQILSQNPYSDTLDTKNMVWLEKTFRLKIGKYRFLYKVENKEVCIYFFKADSRGTIYK